MAVAAVAKRPDIVTMNPRLSRSHKKGGRAPICRPSPPMKVVKNGCLPRVQPDHQIQAIGTILAMDAVGTASSHFYGGLLMQLTNVGCHGQEVDETGLNCAVDRKGHLASR